MLTKLKQEANIDSDTETAARTVNRTPATPPETFGALITQVDYEIQDEIISHALLGNNITDSYCKRTISRATSKPTTIIRVITGSPEPYHKLMNE